MKIRTGFVSNSSSSSFIIRDTDLSIITVAKTMLSIYADSDRNDRLDNFNNLYNSVSEYILPDIAITFQSCNYDTYITKNDDNIYIDTCNNEEWNLPTNTECVGDCFEDESYILDWYWDIDNDLLVSWEENDSCKIKNHYKYKRFINFSTTLYCPKCYTGKRYSEILKEKNLNKKRSFNLRNI